jgi:hypothetical protein
MFSSTPDLVKSESSNLTDGPTVSFLHRHGILEFSGPTNTCIKEVP